MMKLAHRNPLRILAAVAKPEHYRALIQMWRHSADFSDILKRYLTGKGAYPYACTVSTPLGEVAPELYSFSDILTLNEIFFRGDYPLDPTDQVVVDLGSNIGLSALYFLTRGPRVRCYLFEPDPRNVERLRKNLAAFVGRFEVHEQAVSDEAGTLRFGVDRETGRYGGLKVESGDQMMVDCVHINDVLREVLQHHPFVDLLKIDTEGTEIQTLQAIAPDLLKRIRKIYVESEAAAPVLRGFTSRRTMLVYQMSNQELVP